MGLIPPLTLFTTNSPFFCFKGFSSLNCHYYYYLIIDDAPPLCHHVIYQEKKVQKKCQKDRKNREKKKICIKFEYVECGESEYFPSAFRWPFSERHARGCHGNCRHAASVANFT